jgi:ribonuclease PH
MSKGKQTVTHPDGSQEVLTKGMPVYLDDTIETAPDGAVNITFNDNTVFAVSDNAKMVIDEFLYDPRQGWRRSGRYFGRARRVRLHQRDRRQGRSERCND